MSAASSRAPSPTTTQKTINPVRKCLINKTENRCDVVETQGKIRELRSSGFRLGVNFSCGRIHFMDDDDSTRLGKQLVFKQTGKPADVLELETDCLISQAPDGGDVLVRILAAPINPADLNLIEGTYGVKAHLPATPGIEGCGIVEVSGSSDFEEGDQVIFLRRSSTWASHTIVPGETLYKLPRGIDPRQAAMLKVNPATAWRLLHGFVNLKPG